MRRPVAGVGRLRAAAWLDYCAGATQGSRVGGRREPRMDCAGFPGHGERRPTMLLSARNRVSGLDLYPGLDAKAPVCPALSSSITWAGPPWIGHAPLDRRPASDPKLFPAGANVGLHRPGPRRSGARSPGRVGPRRRDRRPAADSRGCRAGAPGWRVLRDHASTMLWRVRREGASGSRLVTAIDEKCL